MTATNLGVLCNVVQPWEQRGEENCFKGKNCDVYTNNLNETELLLASVDACLPQKENNRKTHMGMMLYCQSTNNECYNMNVCKLLYMFVSIFPFLSHNVNTALCKMSLNWDVTHAVDGIQHEMSYTSCVKCKCVC